MAGGAGGYGTVEKLQLFGESPLLPEGLRTAATLLTGLAGLYQLDLVREARRELRRGLQPAR